MSNTPVFGGTEDIVRLSTDLMAQAQEQTGLSDWGGDEFREGLQVLLEAGATEAELTPKGQAWLQDEVVYWLTNRLQIQAAFTAQPQIADVPVERPLFIMGLPRTGSTFLHRLLAQDGNGRVPLLWELSRPTPPPRPETRTTDPRIAQVAEKINRSFHELLPDLGAKHLIDVEVPEECNALFQNSFAAYVTGALYRVPTYQAWVRQQDLTTAYQYYKKQVQLLCYHYPGKTWISKNPDHILGIDAMLKVFPDAAIVYLHRDLNDVFGSICSIQHSLLNMWRETPLAAQEMGEIVLNMMAPTIDQALVARKHVDPAHFYDLQYTELIADPLGAVRQIYEYFGYPLSTATIEQMQGWLESNQQHKHGKHEYELEDFGLTKDLVYERVADYIHAYQLQ